ncbi:hypothetical protein OA88_20475 [Flavobacterium sp. JRM]|nr:hypothetical protein OA88_20475 [Flavobacterium sp. JRM]
MEASSSVKKMLQGNKIFVPTYQRAYSWETPSKQHDFKTQTDIFINDLEDYLKSSTTVNYYFGHFLFEEKPYDTYGIIDGQQRLTTIVIFLSALFTRLKLIRGLTDDEKKLYRIIKDGSTYTFSTVDYDNQLFRDYVIDQTKKDKSGLDTESSKRIVSAFDYFTKFLTEKSDEYLTKMLNAISEASCTTHPVKNESEAIQMFIFQNNRGKKPSNLEIIKAQFMFHVHLYGGEQKDDLIVEIKNRFEKIYKSISSIEYKISEDDVLLYTLRVHFNSLWENNATDKINKQLSDKNPIPFIKSFTHSLAQSFEYLTLFFGKDEKQSIEIHSLVSLGGIAISIPFIIKSYKFGLDLSEKNKLCKSLESLVIRDRLIGTRADLTSRINNDYIAFTTENKSIQPIINRVQFIKTANHWWWAYWNNSELEKSIQGGLHHSTAKFLLWKYENHIESDGKNGYSLMRFDNIENPELEHIAPQTENPEAGYDSYDEEFVNQYINCLGNYLLLSKSHNCSVGNKPFLEKFNSYKKLAQQREIQEMAKENKIWTRELIQNRKEKITKFITENV